MHQHLRLRNKHPIRVFPVALLPVKLAHGAGFALDYRGTLDRPFINLISISDRDCTDDRGFEPPAAPPMIFSARKVNGLPDLCPAEGCDAPNLEHS